MAIQSFYKPGLLVVGTDPIAGRLSDHSRSPLNETFNRIEQSKRMADGTLRKYNVTTKRQWSVSWDLLPSSNAYTVDGFMGANQLRAFYQNNVGAFNLTVVTGQPAVAGDFVYSHPADKPVNQRRNYKAYQYRVHFTAFDMEYDKRGQAYDMYNVSLTMEEI